MASRDADLSQKQDIQGISRLRRSKPNHINPRENPYIQPLAIKKTLIEKMIFDLSSIVKKLEKEKSSLTEGNLLALSHVKTSIENLNS